MKHILLLLLVTILLVGCQKDLQPSDGDYLEVAKKSLKDSLSSSDFAALDFSKAARSRVDSVGFFGLRVPFRGKLPQEDFVFIKTNEAGRIENGKIVHLTGRVSTEDVSTGKRKRWDGSISLTSLDRKDFFESAIVNGYITALHQQNVFRTTSQEPQGDPMPEVIIVYVLPKQGGVSWSTWMCLQSIAAHGPVGGGGYYSSFSGGGSGGGNGSASDSWSGGSYNGGGTPPNKIGTNDDPVIFVDKEMQDENAPIDIEKFINCFTAIPDAGSTCSIEIYADIPVDSDPNKIFNFGTNSPGHTFLNIRKKNGSQSVSQNIGFYPKTGWKTVLTNAPIDGKFVDNGNHEFNCGFTIYITPAQLKSAIIQMESSKNNKYDIDNYNCTDWALDVFNAAGGNLQIPLYDIPGNYPSTGTRMPNGVYNKLLEMKKNKDPRAANVDIGFQKGWAGTSTGPCN